MSEPTPTPSPAPGWRDGDLPSDVLDAAWDLIETMPPRPPLKSEVARVIAIAVMQDRQRRPLSPTTEAGR